MRTIVSDSSCLISLSNAGKLDLLRDVFEEIIITPIVAAEYLLPLPSWIVVVPNRSPIQYSFEGIDLDPGEASAISLAQELGNVLLIVDDLKGRRVAEMLSLNFMGTLGVAVEAKKLGRLPLIRPLIEKLLDSGLYISPALLKRVLSQVQEL